jgi:DNA-binding PadR family transcriptional regulator
MKLTPSAFLMLGMVRLGVRSGYAIKKAADVSTRFFWPTSLAQVYPELARLVQAGLLTRREDPQGSRERFAYELTERGEQAMDTWLRASREAPTQFRDEGVLRLFFADALAEEDQLALVRRLRERVRDVATHTSEEIVPLAEALESSGARFPALVARLRADTYAYVEKWLAQAEAELGVEPGARRAQGSLLDVIEQLPAPIPGPPSGEVLDELRSER